MRVAEAGTGDPAEGLKWIWADSFLSPGEERRELGVFHSPASVAPPVAGTRLLEDGCSFFIGSHPSKLPIKNSVQALGLCTE